MRFSHRFLTGAVVLSILGTLCFHPITAEARRMTAAEQAAAEAAEAERQAVYNKAVDSNSIEGWPQGPQIYAESAIVMEADTGTILYNKDMDMVNYPASITKIMTALVALDHCALDEVMTYSYYATHSIEAGSSTIGTTEGEELTVEESLYALMLESANECGNGLAEHVAGSIDAFVELMNQKAAELGCTNTHFTNPHGLPDENHYTSAHDMALIMQAALQNEDFVRISSTDRYQMRATNKDDEITYMTNHHKMIASYRGDDRFLDDTVIAGKTGYTSAARNTLVTAAERNGMTLIVVTMKTANTAESGIPMYTDTALLLDYASENFNRVSVADNESHFSVTKSNNFFAGSAIFGQTMPLISINPDDGIILPGGAAFTDASPELIFAEDDADSDVIATLSYTYQGQPVGTASILREEANVQDFTFDREIGSEEDAEAVTAVSTGVQQKRFIKINVRLILIFAAIAVAAFLLYRLIRHLMKSFQFSVGFSSKRSRYRYTRARKSGRSSIWRGKNKSSRGRYHRTPKNRGGSSLDDIDL